MSTIQERKETLLTILRDLGNKDERLRYIVEQGKDMPALPESLKLEPFLIKGCISRAWLVPQMKDGHLTFMADSEAMIVKGIIALLLRVYNGSSAAEILSLPPEFLAEAGVNEHLSMNRRNGLRNIMAMIQHYAKALQASESANTANP